MNKPQITIKDIARALNVSPSTVSRALNDNPDISKETRHLVHAYAREHNYKPNVLAVNLRACLLYTSPSPRDGLLSRMPSSA